MTPPLIQAAFDGNFDRVRELLNSGSNINTLDSFGHTALYYAVSNRDINMIEYLIMMGADVNKTTSSDITTPLMQAMEQRVHSEHSVDRRLMALLLDNHADVNIQDRTGNTPLHWLHVMDLRAIPLLRAKADLTIQNRYGSLPLQLEQGVNKKLLQKIIEKHQIKLKVSPF